MISHGADVVLNNLKADGIFLLCSPIPALAGVDAAMAASMAAAAVNERAIAQWRSVGSSRIEGE